MNDFGEILARRRKIEDALTQVFGGLRNCVLFEDRGDRYISFVTEDYDGTIGKTDPIGLYSIANEIERVLS